MVELQKVVLNCHDAICYRLFASGCALIVELLVKCFFADAMI